MTDAYGIMLFELGLLQVRREKRQEKREERIEREEFFSFLI